MKQMVGKPNRLPQHKHYTKVDNITIKTSWFSLKNVTQRTHSIEITRLRNIFSPPRQHKIKMEIRTCSEVGSLTHAFFEYKNITNELDEIQNDLYKCQLIP